MIDPKHIVELDDQVEQTRKKAQSLINETQALVVETDLAIERTRVVLERTRAAVRSDAMTGRVNDETDANQDDDSQPT